MTESWIEKAEQRRLVARDGVALFYEVVGTGPQTMVLANGLGGRLYSWAPLIEEFAPEWRLISWDYRGLFESVGHEPIRRLSIPEHSEDIREILDAEGVEQAVFVGWSMGVQVSLETAALYPERVRALALLNGTYGHVFQTAFQPLFRVPWVDQILHGLIDFLCDRPGLTTWVGKRVADGEPIVRVVSRLYGKLYGRENFEELMLQYLNDIFATDFNNYLRLFQELDAHSVFHLLRELPQPVLIVSGLLDVLTPAYQSAEMARQLKDARHVMLPMGTHFALPESPDKLIRLLHEFLAEYDIPGTMMVPVA